MQRSDFHSGDDFLAFANALDAGWHAQPRTYEREAVTRLLALLTLPARLLDADRPAALVEAATTLRNVRLSGPSARDLFFENQQYTEVDAVFFDLGSPLGHIRGKGAYVVEVERKSRAQQADYLRAMMRARKICGLLQRRFNIVVQPILVYDDHDGALSYARFEDHLVLLPMRDLRRATEGLHVDRPQEIPGRSGDKTLVKLDLLWLLARSNPDDPYSGVQGPDALARAAERADIDLFLPVVGHQDLDDAPRRLDSWLAKGREDEQHLRKRLDKYLNELVESGDVRRTGRGPVLTPSGGNIVMGYTRFLDGEAR